MKPHVKLRAATAADHEAVDTAFSGFDLAERDGYVRFLRAHARALPPVEAAIGGHDLPVPLRSRADLIQADLHALGAAMPDPAAYVAPHDSAEAFGAAYVIEGSRLGGGLIAQGLPSGVPAAYLSAIHLRGEWRSLLQALDDAAGDDAEWLDRAIASARRVFGHYAAAAAEEQPSQS
jgi:heme oxygenase (biliverdin-IX-beta and delta-forming)